MSTICHLGKKVSSKQSPIKHQSRLQIPICICLDLKNIWICIINPWILNDCSSVWLSYLIQLMDKQGENFLRQGHSLRILVKVYQIVKCWLQKPHNLFHILTAPPMAGYPPPAPGAPIQQQPGAPVIVAAAPINFGPDPARIDCPHCRQTIQTTTKSDTSAMGWLLGIGLCLIG